MPELDATLIVVSLVMASVEALKRYAKIPVDLIWLPVIVLGVGFNVGYTALFSPGAALLEAAKMGLWYGVFASGIFSLGKAALTPKE